MDNSLQPRPTRHLPPPTGELELTRTPARPRKGVRRWLVSIMIFLLGMVCGMLLLLIVALIIAPDRPPLPLPSSAGGKDIEVKVGTSYVTHLVTRALNSMNLPGSVLNVRVTQANGDQMTVNGDELLGVAGVGVTDHFVVVIQPFISACQLHAHVLHAEMSQVSMTQFAVLFEAAIDQQLQVNLTKFPAGFTYCTSSVSTETANLIVTYSATPT